MPHYFKHNKVQSLVRQLNMYDFHKIRTKAKEKEFKHEYFKKSKPELLRFIRRKLGEEGNFSTSKSDVLLQKCRDLEERCQTFESMAKLSIPVKKLKVLEQEDCKLLFDGLMAYLDASSNPNSEIIQATSEYLDRLRGYRELEKTSFCLQEASDKPFNQSMASATQVEEEPYLSKRKVPCEDTDSATEDHPQLTYVDERSTCNSMESLEFNMDLLDFDGLFQESCNPLHSNDFTGRVFF